MKMRFFLSVAMLFLAAIPAAAQIRIGGVSTERSGGGGITMPSINPVEQKTIGQATLECTYDFQYYVADVLLREEKSHKDDVMILQTGNGMSKFYSYLSFRSDSLIRQASSPEEVFGNIEKYRGGVAWVLFGNYPEGKITFMDKVGADWFLYEENAPSMNWEIGEETKEIEGYTCQKAECDFRGRHWTAWFSPEIPISEGPWKLGGLPGLIMQAYERSGEYTFTLTGLRQVEARPVTMADRQYLKTNRNNYLKTLRKFTEDPFGSLSQNGVNIVIHKEDGSPDMEIMAPKEMKYDFLETDYQQ